LALAIILPQTLVGVPLPRLELFGASLQPTTGAVTALADDGDEGDWSDIDAEEAIGGFNPLAASDWTESDFSVSGDTITGLSASGVAKLSGSPNYPDLYIPASFPASGVTKIGDNALLNRTSLRSVHVPEGFTSIGAHAVQNCGITSLELPTSLTSIGEQAFMNNALAEYSDGGTPGDPSDDSGFDFATLTGLTTVAKGVFRQNNFTVLDLSSLNNLTSIGENAFMSNKLTSIDIPYVTSIGPKAFASNQLTEITASQVSALTSIDATAFDSNGRVVKISMTSKPATLHSHFNNGSGYVLNPVTITVHYVDYDSTNNPKDPIASDSILGTDFSSNDLYEQGETYSIEPPVYAGYTAMSPAQTLTNIGASGDEEVTFEYQESSGKPVITVGDRVVNQTSSYTEAQILAWASAVKQDTTTSPPTEESIPPTTNHSAPAPYLRVESLNVVGGATQPVAGGITATMTATAGTVIEVTYKAVDSGNHEVTKTIKVTVSADPTQAYIPKADGTPSAWQYRDFTYANETVTVTVSKYPSGDYTQTVTGVTVTGFSAYGNAKYEGTTYSGVNYASVKAAAQANLVLPGIDPSTGQAVVAISSTGAGGGTKFNTKKSNAPGAIDLSNVSALEIIGNDAFSTGDSTTTNSTPAYGELNFGNSGARLTKLRAIGDSAFRWNKVVNLDLSGLTALVLIGDFAFSDSSSNKMANTGGHALQSIDFSNLPSLLAIGDFEGSGGRTFMNSQLRSIDLSGAPNLEQIGIAIFCAAAPSGTTITIPAFPVDLSMLDKLKIIGQFAFRDYPISELNISGMDSLERIDGNNFGHLGSATLEIKDDPKLTMISPGLFSYSVSRQPYTKDTVTTLVIDNCDSLQVLHKTGLGVAGISSDAGFDDLTALSTLVITNNDSLSSIDVAYFSSRTTLTSITIDNNDSLTTIPYQAFNNAPATTLIIANNDALAIIGQEAFLKNRASTLDLSTNPMLTTIGKNAFSQNNSGGSSPSNDGGSYLTSLNLTGLTHLETIGNEAFANAKLTGTLDFTSNTSLKNIGTRAFRSSAITGAAFPPSIELISIMAFAYYSGDSLVLADLPNLKILGAGAFGQYNTEGSPATLKTLELRNLPALVNLNRPDASYNGTPVEAMDFKTDATIETAYCVTPGPDDIFGTNDDEGQGSNIVGGNFGNSLPSLTTLTLDNVGLYGLPPKAFYASPLTSLTIRNMPNLINIGLYGDKNDPNSQTYAGMSYGITSIDGSEKGAQANYGAFENAKLTQLTLDNLPNLEILGNETFRNSPLESLTLTNLPHLKTIGERCFQYATSLTALDLSNLSALEIIGDNAFENAPIETLNLQGDAALKRICYMAFYKNRLTTVDLSNLTSLEIIGSRAFSDGSAPGTAGGGGAAITSLDLSNTPSLKMIGSVDGGSLGDDYKRATYYLCGEGGRTFYGASLTSLDLSSCQSLESVGFAAFLNSPIAELDFSGLNKLQYIGMLAFAAYAGSELTISDLPALYEIGGLAFSAGRTTTNLTTLTLENLPNLTWLSEQQTFAYDADGNLITDTQGYNTTHIGGTTADKAYNQLTTLTLRNLPNLNNIPPHIFYASPLTSLTLEDLGIKAIGYDAFYKAKLTDLSLAGLSDLATIDDRAFYSSPLASLDSSGLSNLKTIQAEAFFSAQLPNLDLSDSTDFVGFPFTVDENGTVHKKAFGDSPLAWVIIGGIRDGSGDDPANPIGNSTDSLYNLNDSEIDSSHQSFNGNNGVPVYVLGAQRNVVTQDGYIMNPVRILIHPVDEDGNVIAPDRVLTLADGPLYGYSVQPPRIAGYLQPGPLAADDYDVLDNPPEGYSAELTVVYEVDANAGSFGYDIHQPQTGITTYDLIGNTLTSKLYVDVTATAQSAIGTDWTFEVSYDPTRVQWVYQELPDFYLINNPGTGTLVLKLKQPFGGGTPKQIPLTWKLIKGPTEEDREFPITITLYDPSGSPMAETPETTYLSGYYNRQQMSKYIYDKELATFSLANGVDMKFGNFDYNNQSFNAQSRLSATYRLRVNTDSSGNNFSRNISAITYYDTLPTYEAIVGGVTESRIASFNPEKNPGWEVAEWLDGIAGTWNSGTASWDGGTPTKVQYQFIGLKTMKAPNPPDLILDFPEANSFQTITNNSNYVAEISEPGGSELITETRPIINDNGTPDDDSDDFLIVDPGPDGIVGTSDDVPVSAATDVPLTEDVVIGAKTFTGNDSIESSVTSEPPGNFVKKMIYPHYGADIASDDSVIPGTIGWFTDTALEKNQEQVWFISVSAKDQYGNPIDDDPSDGTDYYTNYKFEDKDLDQRMQYTAVSLYDFAPATVTAYDAAGNVLFTQTKTSGVTEEKGEYEWQRRVVRFPTAIQPYIARVTVTDTSTIVYSGSSKKIYILTKLRNPDAAENHYEWLWSGDVTAATDPTYNYQLPSVAGFSDRAHYNTQKSTQTWDFQGDVLPNTPVGDDYYYNTGVVTSYAGVHFNADGTKTNLSSVQPGESTTVARIHNLTEGIALSKSISTGAGTVSTGASVIYDLKLNTYDVPDGVGGEVASTGFEARDPSGFDAVLRNWELIEILPTGYQANADASSPTRTKATTDDLFLPSSQLAGAATIDPANPDAGSTLSWEFISEGYTDSHGDVHDVLIIRADVLVVHELSTASWNIGRVQGKVDPTMESGQMVNDAYLNYDPNDSVVKVKRNRVDSDVTTDDNNPYTLFTNPPTDSNNDPTGAGLLTAEAANTVTSTESMIALKYIRGKTSASTWGPWRTDGVTVGGNTNPAMWQIEYRLTLQNNSSLPRGDFLIIDTLPYENSVGITADNDGTRLKRASAFANVLTSVTYDSTNFDLYYLVSDEPIPNVYTDAGGAIVSADDWFADVENMTTTYGVYHWETTMPSDATTVRAIKLESHPGYTLAAGATLDIRIAMDAPIPTEQWVSDSDHSLGKEWVPAVGARANNTFAYQYEGSYRLLETPPVYNEIAEMPAKISVNKVSSIDGHALNGAVYELYDSSGNFVQRQTTANNEAAPGVWANGIALFTNVKSGTYTIKEVQAPPGYQLNKGVWQVVVNPSGAEVTYQMDADASTTIPDPVTDVPKVAQINLKKVATEDDGTLASDPPALPGVRFGLFSDPSCSATSLIAEAVTNSGGYAYWDNLMPGTYYVQELAAPAGYVTAPATVYSVVIPEGAAHQDYYTIDGDSTNATAGDPIANSPLLIPVQRGALHLVKVDNVDGSPLAGARFKITRAAISSYQGARVGDTTTPAGVVPGLTDANEWKAFSATYTTDANGLIDLTGLLAEPETAPGTGGTVYTVEETSAPGKLKPIKFQVVVYPDDPSTAGVDESRTELVAGSVTFADGTALPAGAVQGDFVLADGTGVAPANQTATVTNRLADVTVMKIGVAVDDNAAATKDPSQLTAADGRALAGVGFELWQAASGGVGSDTLIASGVTGSDGQLVFSNLTTGVLYYLKEVAPPAYYEINVAQSWFKLGPTGEVLKPDGTPYLADKVMVRNIPTPVPASLKLTKTVTEPHLDGTVTTSDSQEFVTTAGLGGIRFYIEQQVSIDADGLPGTDDDDGWVAFQTITTTDGSAGTYNASTGTGVLYTDKQGTLDTADDTTGTLAVGQAWLDDIPAGVYRVSEQPTNQAPINGQYLAQNKTYTFAVSKTLSSQSFSYDFSNTPVTPLMVKGDYVGTYDPTDATDQRKLAEAYSQLQTEGKNPYQMVRSDSRIDLVAGLPDAVFIVREYGGSATSGTPLHIWKLTSGADGSFDFSTAVELADETLLDETHAWAGNPSATQTPLVFNEANTYAFVEKKAPTGYQLSSTVTYYQPRNEATSLRRNGGKWLSLENKVLSHELTLSKYAGDTKGAMAGAVFALYYPNGQQVTTDRNGDATAGGFANGFTTDADGLLELPNLAPGTYYLKEISAPAVGGDPDYYEVKPGYYKIVIDGAKDVGGASPDASVWVDKISPYIDYATAGVTYGSTGDPATYDYGSASAAPTSVLNPDYDAATYGGDRTATWDEYTNAFNYIYSPALTTAGDSYAVIYDNKAEDAYTLAIKKELVGEEQPAGRQYYFQVQFSADGGATWQAYTEGNPVTLYVSDLDSVGTESYVMANDVIALRAGERAQILGLDEGMLFRINEVELVTESGMTTVTEMDGWYAEATKTVPNAAVHGTPDEVAASFATGDDVPADCVLGELVTLEDHETVTTDDDEGHHLVVYRNQKSADFVFNKYVLAEDSLGNQTRRWLPGVEFTVYRCSVLADGDPTNDAAHLTITSVPGANPGDDPIITVEHNGCDFEGTNTCWEPFATAVSDNNGQVVLHDLRLYGDDSDPALASQLGTDGNGDPWYGVYLLAETGTPVGYNVPNGYWVLTVDPFAATVTDQVQITAAGELLPMAFELEDVDSDGEQDYLLRNIPAPLFPLTGSTTLPWLWLLAGFALLAAAALFYGRQRPRLEPAVAVGAHARAALGAHARAADGATVTATATATADAELPARQRLSASKARHRAATPAKRRVAPWEAAWVAALAKRLGMVALILAVVLLGMPAIAPLTAMAAPSTGSITIYKYGVDDISAVQDTGNVYGSGAAAGTGEELDASDSSIFSDDHQPMAGITYKLQQVIPAPAGNTAPVVFTDADGIDYIAFSPANTASQATDADGKAVFANLPLGTYLLTEVPDPAMMDVEQDFLVRIPTQISKTVNGVEQHEQLYDVKVYPKGETVAIHKSYSDGRFSEQVSANGGDATAAQKANGLATSEQYGSANIGDTVLWEVVSTIPRNIAELDFYTVTDRYRPGLVVPGSTQAEQCAAIELWAFAALDSGRPPLRLQLGVDYTMTIALDPLTGETVISYTLTPAGQARLGPADDGAGGELGAYRAIEMTVPTRLGDDILLQTEHHNPAQLEVQHTADGIVGGQRAITLQAEDPEVHTGILNLQKVDSADRALTLPGAQFRLVRRSSTDFSADFAASGYVRSNAAPYNGGFWTVTTDAGGLASFKGVAYGDMGFGTDTDNSSSDKGASSDYWLVEYAAPSGYALAGPWPVTVSATSASQTLQVADPKLPANYINSLLSGTGDDPLPLLLTAILAAAGTTMLVIYHRRKRRKPEGGAHAQPPP
jgi:hypothetical protein